VSRPQSDEARLPLAIELAMVLPLRRTAVEGRLKSLLKVLLAHPTDGRLAHLHGVGYLLIDPARPLRALVSLEQDTSVGEFAGGSCACGDEPLEIVSFGVAENDRIFLLHNGASVPTATPSNHITRNGLLGIFNWVAFFYIGIRARQRKWVFWGIFYMVPFVLAVLKGMLNPNVDNWLSVLTTLLIVVLGVMGIVHALRLRGDYLRRLETLESGDATAGSTIRFPPSDRGWELRHSLWIGWTFTLGLFNWIAFVYIGLRAKQWKWILWGVLYLVPIAVVILLLAADASAGLGAPAVLLTFGLGVTPIFHAFRVRKEYLVRLARAKTVRGNVKGGRSTRGPSERREADTDQSDKGMSTEQTDSEAETLDEGRSRQDLGERPSAPRDYVRTPEYGNRVLLPYEELFSVCAKYQAAPYFVGEAIGQKKLTNARLHFPIPDTERIIALIDTSTWGNGKAGLALCEGGMYWHNGWYLPAKTYRTSLSWADFASVSIEFKDDPANILEFGKGNFFRVHQYKIKKEDLVRLFSEVQSLARTYAQEHSPRPTSEEPDASSDQPPEASPSQEPVPPPVAVDDPPRKVVPERLGATSIPTNYPLPLAYSYRLADAEFETFRVFLGSLLSPEPLILTLLPPLRVTPLDRQGGVLFSTKVVKKGVLRFQLGVNVQYLARYTTAVPLQDSSIFGFGE
jgi:hypothetical protein